MFSDCFKNYKLGPNVVFLDYPLTSGLHLPLSSYKNSGYFHQLRRCLTSSDEFSTDTLRFSSEKRIQGDLASHKDVGQGRNDDAPISKNE